MTKALLLLLLVSIIGIPAWAAKDPDPRRGFNRLLRYMLIFNAFYWFNLLFLYGRW